MSSMHHASSRILQQLCFFDSIVLRLNACSVCYHKIMFSSSKLQELRDILMVYDDKLETSDIKSRWNFMPYHLQIAFAS